MQLVFWGIVALIYPVFTIGVPFMEPWTTIENGVFTNLFHHRGDRAGAQ